MDRNVLSCILLLVKLRTFDAMMQDPSLASMHFEIIRIFLMADFNCLHHANLQLSCSFCVLDLIFLEPS